ncbi:MAG: ATP-binding protein [Ferruginibacter sp.]
MQVFTSVIVLAIVFMVYIYTDIRDYKERKAKNVTSLAHVVGMNSVSTILFQDNESAKAILTELKDVAPEIIRADILDKNNNFFAVYVRPGTGSLDTALIKDQKGTLFTDSLLFVGDNIVNNNEFIGRVSLVVELSELKAIKKAKFEMAAILLVAALCISFLIALAVQPYISKRLLYLVNAIKQVSKTQNYNITITDNGKDEISILVKTFNNLMKAVNESQKKKDEFIGIASHELKTPLTSIKGYLDLLNVMEDEEPHKQCVHKALEGTHKLEKLIKDLLDVSKIQSGQLQLNIKEFNIDELLDETIATIQMFSQTHTIIREGQHTNQMIFADREKIEQVLINLLSNAVKYSAAENKVVVSAENNGTALTIKIRDYGIGVPEDELNEIFGRFYRTKNSSVHISGLGLGLYICRDIVLRHKGNIWVERENKGSSFYFSLPLDINKESINTNKIQNAYGVI